jgi:predicted CoA-binding protein
MNVAILGASEREGRYARMAQEDLVSHGHQVFPVTPRFETVLGVDAVKTIDLLDVKIDTVTVYVGSDRVPELVQGILSCAPKRVIFNPGTEHLESMASLGQARIDVVEGCTLVMLRTGMF